MSIISFDELSAYMGGPSVTPAQQALIENIIIPGIQEQLEKYLNCTVELVQVRESLQPESDGYVYFTYAPVRFILSATWSTTGAIPLELQQYQPSNIVVDPTVTRPVINHTGLAGSDSPYRYYTGYGGFGAFAGGWVAPYLVMDYIAGYDGTNDNALKLAQLRVTAREVERQFDTTMGIRSGSLEAGGESDTRPKGWTADELKQFDRLKRRVIV
jgi:hypothetical protein